MKRALSRLEHSSKACTKSFLLRLELRELSEIEASCPIKIDSYILVAIVIGTPISVGFILVSCAGVIVVRPEQKTRFDCTLVLNLP